MVALCRSAVRWLLIVVLAAPGWAVAQGVANLAAPPVLRLSGKIDGGSAIVDSDELTGIGRQTIRAQAPWTAGPGLYQGVPLVLLLEHVGATGRELEIVDRRGHSLGLAIADAVAREAFLVEGLADTDAPLGKRGPFWLVFPLPPDGQPAMGPPAVAGLVELRVR